MTMNEVIAPWLALHNALGVASPIQDEAQYESILAFTESLAGTLPDEAGDPRWGLVELLTTRIHEYENRVHPWPDNSTPVSRLKYLMAEHGLSQKDLPEVGSQSVISDVLCGKRKINLRQAKALAGRFHVPMDVFAA